MPYTTDIVKPLADQLAKFVTLNRHQLAGHVANLDFWLGEVRHAIAVLDGYGERFERMRTAQQRYISEHGTIEFDLDDPCCTQMTPSPMRVPDGPMREARRALRDVFYRFLIRCHNDGFLAESRVREACRDLDIGIEARDLRSRQEHR